MLEVESTDKPGRKWSKLAGISFRSNRGQRYCLLVSDRGDILLKTTALDMLGHYYRIQA